MSGVGGIGHFKVAFDATQAAVQTGQASKSRLIKDALMNVTQNKFSVSNLQKLAGTTAGVIMSSIFAGSKTGPTVRAKTEPTLAERRQAVSERSFLNVSGSSATIGTHQAEQMEFKGQVKLATSKQLDRVEALLQIYNGILGRLQLNKDTIKDCNKLFEVPVLQAEGEERLGVGPDCRGIKSPDEAIQYLEQQIAAAKRNYPAILSE